MINNFTYFKVEQEKEWILDCIVIPEVFNETDLIKSSIIFGKEGSGKTTLKYIIEDKLCSDANDQKFILINWSPIVSTIKNRNQEKERIFQINALFKRLIIELIKIIIKNPLHYKRLQSWKKKIIISVIQKYFNLDNLIRHFPEIGITSENETLIHELVKSKLINKIQNIQPERNYLFDLFNCLSFFSYENVFIIVDEVNFKTQDELISQRELITSVFSILEFFEHKNLIVKIFLPYEFEDIATKSQFYLNGRIWKFYIEWGETSLLKIVENRLRISPFQDLKLSDIGDKDNIYNWLILIGCKNPRNWLKIVAILLDSYLQNNKNKLNNQQIFKAIKKFPVDICFDKKKYEFDICTKKIKIDEFSPTELKIFKYLLNHPCELISKNQLYYEAYLDSDSSSQSKSEIDRLEQISNQNIIDVCIHRLRKVIEPNPNEPFLIESIRGHGIILKIANYLERDL